MLLRRVAEIVFRDPATRMGAIAATGLAVALVSLGLGYVLVSYVPSAGPGRFVLLRMAAHYLGDAPIVLGCGVTVLLGIVDRRGFQGTLQRSIRDRKRSLSADG